MYTVPLTLIGKHLMDFPFSGGLARREISRWAPASSFSGPLPYARIYFIDNQLSQSEERLGIQHTGHGVRRVSPSERTTVMYVSYSFTCRLPPIRIKIISDEN